MTDMDAATRTSRRPTGPHPGIVSLVSFLLMLGGIALGAALSGGAALGSPFAPSADVAARIADHSAAVQAMALLQVGSAIPLGIAAGAFYGRQQRLGIRVPGPVISLYGGILASIMLLMSGLAAWVSARPELASDAAVVHALSFLAFITGSVGFVLGIGLFIAGIAVPALILRLLPAWLAWTGLVIALCAELSFFAMVAEPLQFLFPIGRFLGMLWLVVAGFLLPRDRTSAHRAGAPAHR